ncbi:acyltransferase [Vibrio salinus]|uniref:acyltransferase n=1 Tax=Vibrio salinus TaxID=2899784 RepID=UPI001E497E93|nr:acyltransferase [Vibrio salinus]MCE0493762.1 acyltransferase [Vibrio salinus]
MAYLSADELKSVGFKYIGKGVKVSKSAAIYDAELIELDDYARIDDLCILSGRVTVGKYCHITPMCLVAGGIPGVYISDFCTLAYGVKIFSQSDDYSGETMVNSLIPKKYKNEFFAEVILEKHVIVGTNSVIFPGVTISEGCSIGAMSLVSRSTKSWGVYVGSPARYLKPRKKNILELEKDFISGQ